MSVEFREFPDREAGSRAAAELLAKAIREDLGTGREASLVLSGGTTPGCCFEFLSETALDWPRVTVLPSDERWVAADDPNSNERLIRETLFRARAAGTGLLPFYRPGLEPAEAVTAIQRDLGAIRRPFSGVLLGMGGDGHFASLFPDYDDLAKALDVNDPLPCTLVQTAGSPFLRISLTLSAILDSNIRVLLIFGEEKRRVLQSALDRGSELPVTKLLSRPGLPVRVIWAP